MTINPFYRSLALSDEPHEYFWSRNRYAVLQYYKCTRNRYFLYYNPHYFYTNMEYVEISNENTADEIRYKYPNNMIKIYSTHDMAVDVVITSKMYFTLVSGNRIIDDAEGSCIESIIHYLMDLLPFCRFIKNELYNDMMSNMAGFRFTTECQVDPISLALLDASSWIHHYVI